MRIRGLRLDWKGEDYVVTEFSFFFKLYIFNECYMEERYWFLGVKKKDFFLWIKYRDIYKIFIVCLLYKNFIMGVRKGLDE